MKKTMVKFLFVSVIFTFFTIYNYVWFTNLKESDFGMDPMDKTKAADEPHYRPKIILLWNSFWDAPGWEVGLGNEPFQRLGCPVQNCLVTDNRELFNISDAVLFHIHDLGKKAPPTKRDNQRWVFFMLESPGWSRNMEYKQWKSLFNWTMTYRLDSDIRLHYGQVEPVKKRVARPRRRLHKPKGIAWVVSNCRTTSLRGEYVRELQKYIPVDVYGKCGNLTCVKDWVGNDQACLEMISRTYKFYLAFENNFCKDYVTEKFFKVLPFDVVPVVRGAANYSMFVPHKWFINTNEFTSPKQLADYLKFLIRNPQEYQKYFQHRDDYNLRAHFGIKDLPSWCQLCEKLQKEPTGTKWYEDIAEWWSSKDCYNPRDL